MLLLSRAFFICCVTLLTRPTDQTQLLNELIAIARKLNTKNDISMYSSQYVLDLVESNLGDGLIMDTLPTPGGTPVLSVDTLAEIVSACRSVTIDEHKLIVYFTPIFEAILLEVESPYVLVNSEEYKWLPQHNLDGIHDLKPDMFVVLRGMYQTRKEPNPLSLQEFRRTVFGDANAFRFGVPMIKFLDAIKLIVEWKVRISPKDRALMYLYLLHLSRETPNLVRRGLLCDSRGFFAIRCLGGIQQVQFFDWTRNGSKDILKEWFAIDRFASPWIVLLDRACTLLNAGLHQEDAFLGGGAFGKVFRVQHDNEIRALKIVLSANPLHPPTLISTAVAAEFRSITEPSIFPEDAAYIVHGVPNSLHAFEWDIAGDTRLLGYAYLLAECGFPLDAKRKDDVRAAFQALSCIHALRHFHGDARIANAIAIIDGDGNQVVKWIDFMQYSHLEATATQIRWDLNKLAESVEKRGFEADDALLHRYMEDPRNHVLDIFTTMWVSA